jgi:hypothetical protein
VTLYCLVRLSRYCSTSKLISELNVVAEFGGGNDSSSLDLDSAWQLDTGLGGQLASCQFPRRLVGRVRFQRAPDPNALEGDLRAGEWRPCDGAYYLERLQHSLLLPKSKRSARDTAMPENRLVGLLFRLSHLKPQTVALPTPVPDAVLRPVQNFDISHPSGASTTGFGERLFRHASDAADGIKYVQDASLPDPGEEQRSHPPSCTVCGAVSESLFAPRLAPSSSYSVSTVCVCLECYPGAARRHPPTCRPDN